MKSQMLVFVCTLGLIGTAWATTPTTAEVSAPIHRFIDNFNKGDGAAAAATLAASGVVIIDEVPPYLWQGTDAFKAWSADLAANDKQQGISGERLTLGNVTRTESSGDHAYVIVDAVYTYSQRAAAMREAGQMTFALQHETSGWHITAWTWTGPTPRKVK
jgi:hypothetical protein